MNHDELQEKIFLLDDPEVPASEKEPLIHHLKACDGCQKRLDQWRSLSAEIRSMARPEPNLFLERRIMARLQTPKKNWRGRVLTFFPSLRNFSPIGLTLAALILVGLWLPSPDEDEVSTEALLLADAGFISQEMYESDDPDEGLILEMTLEEP